VAILVSGWQLQTGDYRRAFGILPLDHDMPLKERLERFYAQTSTTQTQQQSTTQQQQQQQQQRKQSLALATWWGSDSERDPEDLYDR
jgi:hypothetical protein